MDPRANARRRTKRSTPSAHGRVRWLVAGLLVVFALVQGVALSHAAVAGHDHDGACAACRLVGEHASAIAPTPSIAHTSVSLEPAVPGAPLPDASFRPGRSHAPRAPPSP